MTGSGARGIGVWLDLALLSLCWASGFTFTAMALEGLAPEWLVAFRQLIATLMLLAIAAALGRLRAVPKRFWVWLAVMAVLGDVAPFYVISWGQTRIESGLASILVSTMPLMTLSLAHFFVANERVTLMRLLAFAAGLAGVALIFGPELADTGTDGQALFAQGAVLFGALLFAVNAIVAQRMPPMDIWMRAVMVNALSFVIILVPAWSLTPPPAALPTGSVLIGALGAGIFASGLATVIFFRLIDRAGPAFMSLTNYLVPPVALLAGAALLSERPTLESIVGLLVILLAIAISERRVREKSPPPDNSRSGPAE